MGCSNCGKNNTIHQKRIFTLLDAGKQSIKTAVGIIPKEEVYVSNETREKRVSICSNCPGHHNYLDSRNKLRCDLCSCFMRTKAMYRDAECLANKNSGDVNGPYWLKDLENE